MPRKREGADDMVAVADEEGEEDDVFQNMESVKGTLFHISEGGAALDVEKGDVVKVWPADTLFVLSKLAGGVVSKGDDESADENAGNLLSCAFISCHGSRSS